MKKEDLPQDESALKGSTRELCYVKDKDGKYTTDLSSGWSVKKDALDSTWDDINETVAELRKEVSDGKISPIAYFMEKNLMDVMVLSGYTGFWGITVKRHMKPSVFKGLSDSKLQKYADAFGISLEELKTFDGR